ncbi:unnamed protein product [Protopolystoma xenopodis]|uniref:Uncharacterized protein n=1 Tax=Protopolystoma xenopodis TaxID=117903 RepID=A0A448XMC8_9PLAT|nr:unnamed protein product [Protopolystoma xenopodis]
MVNFLAEKSSDLSIMEPFLFCAVEMDPYFHEQHRLLAYHSSADGKDIKASRTSALTYRSKQRHINLRGWLHERITRDPKLGKMENPHLVCIRFIHGPYYNRPIKPCCEFCSKGRRIYHRPIPGSQKASYSEEIKASSDDMQSDFVDFPEDATIKHELPSKFNLEPDEINHLCKSLTISKANINAPNLYDSRPIIHVATSQDDTTEVIKDDALDEFSDWVIIDCVQKKDELL